MSLRGVVDDAPRLFAVAQLPRGSGVLFAPRRVLTAAHCVDPITAVRFRSGDAWTAPLSGRAFVHPDYALPRHDDGRVAVTRVADLSADLAVIELDDDPTLDGAPIAPLALDDDEALTVGAQVSLIGFGDGVEGSSLAHLRRRGDARITTVYPAHLAIEARDGAVMTAGDSGGPLVVDRGAAGLRVVGVASVFAEGVWSLFARVSAHRAWLATRA